jgi:hypothetical protein
MHLRAAPPRFGPPSTYIGLETYAFVIHGFIDMRAHFNAYTGTLRPGMDREVASLSIELHKSVHSILCGDCIVHTLF